MDDGDTLNVKVDGKGSWEKVRLNGVQAMELHEYKHNHREGECGSVKATLRLAELVKATGKNVRLYAMKPNSKADGNRIRYRRALGVKAGGKWVDAGSVLMAEGLEHEWVTITNTSPAPISLYEYELESVPWFYEFSPEDVLQPGKDVVTLRNPQGAPVACDSWGGIRCPGV